MEPMKFRLLHVDMLEYVTKSMECIVRAGYGLEFIHANGVYEVKRRAPGGLTSQQIGCDIESISGQMFAVTPDIDTNGVVSLKIEESLSR